MGDYFFFGTYHLAHLELPITIAELALDRQPIASPTVPPVAEVAAIAKRDLEAGTQIDDIRASPARVRSTLLS
jgi:predicted homoserine dehydrogenase-like protein